MSDNTAAAQGAAGIKEKKPLTKAQIRKKNKRVHTWLRAGIQVVFFVIAPSLFTESFNGIKAIFQAIAEGSMIQWNDFLTTLVILCIFTMLLGRFFCGYACAFGALGDWIYALSAFIQEKLGKKKKKKKLLPDIPVKVKKGLQYIKYVLLAAIVAMCALGIYDSVSGASPWSVFSMARSGNLRLAGYAAGGILLILIILGMAWQERFFCQYLCPMGAVFALLPKLPWTSLRRNRENCIKGCSACEKQCPVSLGLDTDTPKEGECIRCGKCVGTCPKENIKTGVPKWKGDEWWAVLSEAAALLILVELL